MKRYVREVFIPRYAKNFNKGLSASDIKFYGKIHFDRSRSDNELNMHCHLIVSRKDQANKKKISPLTNHKNTKKGTVTGGFDRVNLFQQAEQGFDKLFGYNRPLSHFFEYYNTMKNSSISEQLEMQDRQVSDERKNTDIQTGLSTDKQENKQESKQKNIYSFSQTELGVSSVLGLFTPDIAKEEEQQLPMRKKETRF